jgi:hypothetical protein
MAVRDAAQFPRVKRGRLGAGTARRLSDVWSSLARLKKVQPYKSPKVQALAEPTLFAGLRLAMPEE